MKNTKEDKIEDQILYLAFKVLQTSEAALAPDLSRAVGMYALLQYIIIYCYCMFVIYYYLFAIRKITLFTLIFSSRLHF